MTTIDISHTVSLNILLGDPPGSVSPYHYSFHAGDTIKGSIAIRSEVDLQFETLDIFFIGIHSIPPPASNSHTNPLQAKSSPPATIKIHANSITRNTPFQHQLYRQKISSKSINATSSPLHSQSQPNYPPQHVNIPLQTR